MAQQISVGLAGRHGCVNHTSTVQLASMNDQLKYDQDSTQPKGGDLPMELIGQKVMREQGPSWREVVEAFRGQLGQAIRGGACSYEGISLPQAKEEVVGVAPLSKLVERERQEEIREPRQ